VPQRRPRHASAVPLRPCRDKGVQPQFDLVERVGGGGEHCVEHRIDDVSLAPSRRKIGSEDRRQRDSLVVQGQQVVVRNEDLNLHGPQAVPGLPLLRLTLDIAAKREDDGLAVSVEGPRGVAVGSAPQSAQRALVKPERGDQIFAARLAKRDVEPKEAPLGAQCGDTLSLGGVQPVEDLRHGPSDYEANRRSKQP
jgi:hypothetical protein